MLAVHLLPGVRSGDAARTGRRPGRAQRLPGVRLLVVMAATATGTVSAADAAEPGLPVAAAFQFDTGIYDPISYSRVQSRRDERLPVAVRQTEFSFSLRPGLPDFSRAGVYGLAALGSPELAVNSGYLGRFRLSQSMPDLHEGFSYSAGLRVEHEEAAIDGTAFVSSSLLGLSYGRLGRLWYGGVDVNIEQFSDEQFGVDQPDVLSLDFTTGRRLGWTGSSKASPLWLLTVQGSFDVQALEQDDTALRTDWYLNPSLLWQRPGFTFAAQVQLPVDAETLQADDPTEPDYRLRAIFEKRF